MFIDNYKESDVRYDACLSRCNREGRRRNPTNWTYDSVPQPQYMHRGYTMHEMLDEFGLINMNGRCYDPVVGRFLSPDIIVQNPNNTQCYNRYSYAINNPLKYTDPSGWSYSPSVRWRSSFNGMQRRAIDLIFSKNWKPSEFNELAGLLEMSGGNSLNITMEVTGETLMDQHLFVLRNMSNLNSEFVDAVKKEYYKLVDEHKYTDAAYLIVNSFKFDTRGRNSVKGKYFFSEKTSGEFTTAFSKEESQACVDGTLIPCIIEINTSIMAKAYSFSDVFYKLYHEITHVFQFQLENMYDPKYHNERDFLAYSKTMEYSQNNPYGIRTDQKSFDGGYPDYNLGWKGWAIHYYERLDKEFKNYYKVYYDDIMLLRYNPN